MIERRRLLSTLALCMLVTFATTAAGSMAPAFAKGSGHDSDAGGHDDGGGNDDSGNDDGGSGGRGSDDPAGHDANDDNGNDADDGADDSGGDGVSGDTTDDNPGASTRNHGGRICAAGTNCNKG